MSEPFIDEREIQSDHPQGRNSLSKREIRQALLALKYRLLGFSETTEDSIKAEDERAGSEPADIALSSQDETVTLGLIGNTNGQIAAINDALSDLDNGQFGRCIECGDKIPIARITGLQYLVRTCIKCQMKLEKENQ